MRDEDDRWRGNDALWRHRYAVARCAGSACFAAIALHFGTDSPIVLERRIDRRRPYLTELGTPVWAGTYRRWRNHGVVPSAAKSALIEKRSGGSVHIRTWSRSWLWPLLAEPTIVLGQTELLYAFPAQIVRILLRSAPRNDTAIVWLEARPPDVQALFRLGSLNAFLALLLLARHAERLGSTGRDLYASQCAYRLLPQILYQTPVLRYRWSALYQCIERVLKRSFSEPISMEMSERDVASRLTELDQRPCGASELNPPPIS